MAKQVMNPADVGLSYPPGVFHFLLEALNDGFGSRNLGTNGLEGDLFLQFKVCGLIDFTPLVSGYKANRINWLPESPKSFVKSDA